MLSLFKIWAAENVQSTWNWEMERFIRAKNPQTHKELELAIQEFQSVIA